MKALLKDELSNETSAPILSNGAVGDFSSSVSSQQQFKEEVLLQNVASNCGVGIVSTMPAAHSSTATLQQQEPASLSLSCADTSSMSYPPSKTRNTASKSPLSILQHQV
ncbi:unnamed protein product [Toxocara canis]|uniref:Protein Smaug n=1 Tax=Toxocara canis TaxID=6265 RepID=A0A183U6M6_TOXCA|nr:unnamed protein product [Toxocara canis]